MENTDVVYLWRNRLWGEIIFFNCLILNENINFSNWILEQSFEFHDCDFKGGLSQKWGERDFISKASNAISDIWMLSKHRYKDDETRLDVNMLDEVCITRNTRSL